MKKVKRKELDKTQNQKKNEQKKIAVPKKTAYRKYVSVNAVIHKTSGTLRERMKNTLKTARFRYLNEQLYLSNSNDCTNIFTKNPSVYEAYHEGFKQQVEQWPVNPIEVIIKMLQKRVSKEKLVIADFGCGEALLAQQLKNAKVFSFDLVASNELVTACDMKHTNLFSESVDIVVFCLSLMGTDLSDYIKEACRVLKVGGLMKIAEVESRFDNLDEFINQLTKYGFQLIHKDLSFNLFYFFDFKKSNIINKKKKKLLPSILLKPCIYKKR